MDMPADPPHPDPANREVVPDRSVQAWALGMARRALPTLGVAILVALFLTLVAGHRFWMSLLYSTCIALACWTFIDGGLQLAARWVYRNTVPPEGAARPEWPGLGWIMGIVVLGTLGGIAVGTAVADALAGVRSLDSFGNPRVLATLLMIALVPGVAITYFSWSRSRLAAERARAEVAQRQAAENRLRLLESQLEPHMLFNTLANLRVLIGLDPARAQRMLDHLIAFLRATLNASRASRHPLSLEFERLADYLALMKIRMGERLQTELDLPAPLAGQPVPALLLQPLVENAIKHGLEPKVEGGSLRISASAEDGRLVLRVHDTGVGPTSRAGAAEAAMPSASFGLQQVRERLETLHGERSSLTLEAVAETDGGGTRVTVRMPLRPADSHTTPSLARPAP